MDQSVKNADIAARLELYEWLLGELKTMISADADSKNAIVIPALTQLILKEGRLILDHIFFDYGERKFETELKKLQVSFPIVNKEKAFLKSLERAGLSGMEKDDSVAYRYLEALQPYKNNLKWLSVLSDFSRMTHRGVVAQDRRQNITIKLKESLHINAGLNLAKFGEDGMESLADKSTVDTDCNQTQQIPVEIQKTIERYFSDNKSEVISFCQEAGTKIKQIAIAFEGF